MAEEIKELHESLNKVFAEFKEVNDRSEKKDALQKEHLAKLNTRFDEIEVAQKRVSMPIASPANDMQKKAFGKFLRKGVENLSPDEVKVLTVGDDTQAGYLASPPDFQNRIIEVLTEISPVRSVASVMQTSKSSVQIPSMTTPLAGSWTAEVGSQTEESALRVGMEEIPVHEQTIFKDVSNMLLEDSAFNLESVLAGWYARAFEYMEGTAFIAGNAVGKPEGITKNADLVTGALHMGSTSAVSADKLWDALLGLKAAYARNARWLMNRTVVSAIRQLKDGTTGVYLWQPSMVAGIPATLCGIPVVDCPDMPNIASASLSIAVGDFNAGYLIVDRVGISVLRDPYTQAAKSTVRILARRRVGGQVVLPEAIRLIVMSS